ncbi:MAG: hypothetical protein LBV53_02510 [Mycoplasmataceae bacterium]|nr:hypothetical protein [Mycoplasmataceae bacterium]
MKKNKYSKDLKVIVLHCYDNPANQHHRTVDLLQPYNSKIIEMMIQNPDWDELEKADLIIVYDIPKTYNCTQEQWDKITKFFQETKVIKAIYAIAHFPKTDFAIEWAQSIDWDFIYATSPKNYEKNVFPGRKIRFVNATAYEELDIPITLANLTKAKDNKSVLMPGRLKTWKGWDILQKMDWDVDVYCHAQENIKVDNEKIKLKGFADRDKLLREIAPNYLVFFEYCMSDMENWDDLTGVQNFTLYEFINLGLIPIVNLAWLKQQKGLRGLLCFFLDDNLELKRNFDSEKYPVIEILNYNKLLCHISYNKKLVLEQNRKAIYNRYFFKALNERNE